MCEKIRIMRYKKGGEKMRYFYLKPKLKDLTQGSRIAFVRQFRRLTQDEVSEKLGLSGESKRVNMTRYEKGERNPKEDRLIEIANILKVNPSSIGKYDFKNPLDIVYIFMWLEELYPKMNVELATSEQLQNKADALISNFIKEWQQKKQKREDREISYEEYIEWKLTFQIKGE